MLKRLWLAEDDPDDVELFMEALRDIDPSVAVVAAQSGLDLIRKLDAGQFHPPELIFLDVNMPEMNGWDCLDYLKRNTKLKDIPVVMYSTSSASKNAQQAIDSGAFCFYEKPTNFLLLKEFLDILINTSPLDKDNIAGLVKAKNKNQKIFIG